MKKNQTRRALLMSALSLLLCVSMLIGTTFAWFTDEVVSGMNTISAGNLDVELWANGVEVGTKTKLFDDATLWEPGVVVYENLQVVNKGTLALKYQMTLNFEDENDLAGHKLSEVLKVAVLDKAIENTADRAAILADAKAAANVGSLYEFIVAGELEAGKSSAEQAVVIFWEPQANEIDNLYNANNGKSTSNGEPLGITFGVKLLATQFTVEEDSFDELYDKDAWVKAMRVNSIDELKLALENVEDGGKIVFGNDIEDADGVLITNKDVTIDLNGNTFTVREGSSTSNRVFKVNGDSQVVIKNGTLIADGTTDAGAYGTIRTEGSAKVTLENMKLYNYRGGGLNVKAVTGTTVIINNSEIYSQYGGGVEASGGNIVLNNTKITQKGVYGNGWYSVPMEINSSGSITVNSGEYTGSAIATDANAAMGNCVAFILSSGGTLTINGGTFEAVVAETASASNFCGVIYADRAAVVNINGGNFVSNGAILDMRNNAGTQPNPVANLSGGTFSADPRISGLYASNLIKVADGYATTQNANGTWTVDREYKVVTPAAGADKIANGKALSDAIAETETPYIQLGEGVYKMPSPSTNKNLTIVGTKDTVIDNTMGSYMDSATVTFEGVTIKGSTGKVEGTGSDYAAFYSPNVTYINCTFDGPFFIGRDGATFIGCTFTNLGNDYVWTYGNDCTFENCTFNTDGKAILIYNDGGNEVAKVTVKNCVFNATAPAKAGAIANQSCACIEIQNYGNGVDLTTDGNTVGENFSGLWRIKTYHLGHAAVIVNGVEYNTIAIDGKIMAIDPDKNVTVQ